MLSPDLIIPALAAAGSAGAAWGAVKVSLNGTRSRVRRMEKDFSSIVTDAKDSQDRLARLETKIDLLLAGQLRFQVTPKNPEHPNE
jgi:hypothetical protein